VSGESDLDRLHAAMAAAPADEAARRAFHGGLAASLLHVLLTEEPAAGEAPAPRLFEIPEGSVALAFDSEARLAAFLEAPAPYAALPGRVLARLLAAREAGMLVNAGAPSATLLPAPALAWLAGALEEVAQPVEAPAPELLSGPPPVSPALIAALEARLCRAGGLARQAVLAGARQGGARHPLLAFIGAAPGAEAALANAVAEAIHFSGEAATLDIAFVAGTAPAAERLLRLGLVIELPAEEVSGPAPPAPPGSGPAPPRLV